MTRKNINYMDLTINPTDLEILDEIKPKYKKIREKILNNQNFYMYNQAEELIAYEIYPRFRDADKDKNNRGRICFLYGDYDTGKSFLLRYAARMISVKCKKYWNLPEAWPIIIIDVPDNINSAKQFLLFLLSELGYPLDPVSLKNWGKTHEIEKKLRQKLIYLLEKYQTRILILDECQRLLNSRNRNLPNIFECIKDLTNKCNWSESLRTSIIFSGTHDGLPLLESTDWIQGRTHSIRMRELENEEYAYLLWTVYSDYIDMGISPDWNLALYNENTQIQELNPEVASFLYQRTRGRVALTVEIIRDAVIKALNRGKLHPSLDDYKIAIIEGEKYESVELNPQDLKILDSDTDLIQIKYEDRFCMVKGCVKAKYKYSNMRNLLNHYKRDHKDIVVINSVGGRM